VDDVKPANGSADVLGALVAVSVVDVVVVVELLVPQAARANADVIAIAPAPSRFITLFVIWIGPPNPDFVVVSGSDLIVQIAC